MNATSDTTSTAHPSTDRPAAVNAANQPSRSIDGAYTRSSQQCTPGQPQSACASVKADVTSTRNERLSSKIAQCYQEVRQRKEREAQPQRTNPHVIVTLAEVEQVRERQRRIDNDLINANPRNQRNLKLFAHRHPHELVNHRELQDTRVKGALIGFMGRLKRNPWMQSQRDYPQRAALAAANAAYMPIMPSYAEGGLLHLNVGPFDGVGLLNCGWANGKQGRDAFQRCHQLTECPSCNRWERVEPAKKEFLPAFAKGGSDWYGMTSVVVSDPAKAGVKIETGRDDHGQPVYEYLFRLSDLGTFSKFPKFGLDEDWDYPMGVAEALYSFHNWLTNNRIFNGLAGVGETDFTYFPDPSGPLGIGNTVNCHVHAFGNTTCAMDARMAQRIFLGCLKALQASGRGRSYGYPDILFKPITTSSQLVKTINYVYKPANHPQVYEEALRNGCDVEALNYNFHQDVYGSMLLFPGCGKGFRYGNMSSKSRHRYIGLPQRCEMSDRQLERYHERVAEGTALNWEQVRFQGHQQRQAAASTASSAGIAQPPAAQPVAAQRAAPARLPAARGARTITDADGDEESVPQLTEADSAAMAHLTPSRNQQRLRHVVYYKTFDLGYRGWTRGMIKTWLGNPDKIERRQPFGKIFHYESSRVCGCEAQPAFKAERAKWAALRQKRGKP